ncbi:MAG: ABC transporter substrate-binding protein [Methylobacteriaceae bacterium]|jgi:iron(III) transport system substrate-binding protein|nr:ABC transporter substrate-binding protein [Methylobacteriaceae bacterium]
MKYRLSSAVLAAVFTTGLALPVLAADNLVVYTSMKESLIGALRDEFLKQNPDVNFDYQSAGAGKLMAKIAAERQSGKIQTDVLWTSEVPDFYSMKNEGLLLQYKTPELDNVINPFDDYDGSFTAVRLGTLGIAYNTRFIKEAPKTWDDLKKPEYKKAYGIANPALSGTSFMSIALMVKQFGWPYFEDLKANGAVMGKGSGQVVDDTASGELVASLAVDYITIDKIKKGATLNLVYPPEMLVIPSPVCIFKGTPNEAVAKKFVDFLLSEAGQKIIASEGTLPVRKGVPVAHETLPTPEEAAGRAIKIDYIALMAEKEATIKKFSDLMMGK